MKTFKPTPKTRIASGLGLTAVAGVSSAALPAAVDTALADAITNIGLAGALSLGAYVGAVAFKMIRRAV